MTDFNGNTSTDSLRKTLTQWLNTARQRIELLKEKQGRARLLQPDGGVPRHSKPHWPRRARAGLTMFEATLWSLLAITVLVSVLGLYNGVTNSMRTAALRSQLTRAVAIIERDHIYSGTYTGPSLLGFLNDEGFNNKEFRRISAGTYEFRTPYDTAITIVPDSSDDRKFVVVVNDLPAAACEITVSAFSDRGSGLDEVTIGAKTILQPDITEAAVTAACDAGDGINNVTLTF